MKALEGLSVQALTGNIAAARPGSALIMAVQVPAPVLAAV